MKVKTSELDKEALNWAVAKCEEDSGAIPFFPNPLDGYGNGPIYTPKNYSENWARGGPIIEREKINVAWETFDTGDLNNGTWVAGIHTPPQGVSYQEGSSMLIAAMRCFVFSKFGEEIDIPDVLIKNKNKERNAF